MKRLATAAVVLALVSGCYTTKVTTPARTTGKGGEVTSWYFVNGLTGADIKASECSGAISSIEHSEAWWHRLVFGLTASLVDARTTKYECAQ